MTHEIQGTVFTGIGDGAHYISMDHYSNTIEEATGFKPFPGTLNLYVDPEDRKRLLEKTEDERVEAVDDYIGFNVHKVKIGDVKAAVLDLDMTDHGDDVIEVVAPVELREKFGLEDGDQLKVEF